MSRQAVNLIVRTHWDTNIGLLLPFRLCGWAVPRDHRRVSWALCHLPKTVTAVWPVVPLLLSILAFYISLHLHQWILVQISNFACSIPARLQCDLPSSPAAAYQCLWKRHSEGKVLDFPFTCCMTLSKHFILSESPLNLLQYKTGFLKALLCEVLIYSF